MATQIQQAERFLALHHQPQPLLLPNPWDAGLGEAAGLARLLGPGHHQQRVRGDRWAGWTAT